MKGVILLLALVVYISPRSARAVEPGDRSLFGESYNKVFTRPFFATATLSVRRPAWQRNQRLWIYYRDPRRAFVRVISSSHESSTIALRKEDHVYLFFPRADLLLSLPLSMGAFPLFGSDFSADDLLGFGDLSSRFVVRSDGEETLSGVYALRYRLAPRVKTASLYSEIKLWLARDSRLPLRQELISEQGKVLREVVMESDGRFPFPTRWNATTYGSGGGESELVFGLFERDPPVKDELFTVAGLRSWR